MVVVITGGTAGVGRATARRFARDRARIAVLARGPDGLAATEQELRGLGAEEVLALPCDVADADRVLAAAYRIERDLGPIDVWINNAMTTVFGRFVDVEPYELRRVTDVTYHGYAWGTRAALAVMRPRGRGTIVQVGSALAHRAIPLQAAYCAAKHAIRAMTDSIRSELIHEGSEIALTMVQLPAVNTPQFRWCLNRMERAPQPVPPIYQPEVVAEAIHRAALHPRREVFVGARTVQAVVGNKLIPGLLDRHLARVGWDGQLTARPSDPGAQANLFDPVPGDHGAHGDFDDQARPRDPLVPVTAALGAAGVQAVLALAVLGGAYLAMRLARRA